MTRVYVADAKPEERSALCLSLLDLNMEAVGEAATGSPRWHKRQSVVQNMLLIEISLR